MTPKKERPENVFFKFIGILADVSAVLLLSPEWRVRALLLSGVIWIGWAFLLAFRDKLEGIPLSFRARLRVHLLLGIPSTFIGRIVLMLLYYSILVSLVPFLFEAAKFERTYDPSTTRVYESIGSIMLSYSLEYFTQIFLRRKRMQIASDQFLSELGEELFQRVDRLVRNNQALEVWQRYVRTALNLNIPSSEIRKEKKRITSRIKRNDPEGAALYLENKIQDITKKGAMPTQKIVLSTSQKIIGLIFHFSGYGGVYIYNSLTLSPAQSILLTSEVIAAGLIVGILAFRGQIHGVVSSSVGGVGNFLLTAAIILALLKFGIPIWLAIIFLEGIGGLILIGISIRNAWI